MFISANLLSITSPSADWPAGHAAGDLHGCVTLVPAWSFFSLALLTQKQASDCNHSLCSRPFLAPNLSSSGKSGFNRVELMIFAQGGLDDLGGPRMQC